MVYGLPCGMRLLLLGGKSLDQQQWIREVERELAPHFAATHVLDYNHWREGTSVEDIPHEVESLLSLADSISREYVLFGKSMGTLVAAEAIRQGRVNPRYCIFAGVPFRPEPSHPDNQARFSYFAGYETPTLVLQNPDERFMRPEQLRRAFDKLGIKDCEIVPGTGGIHSYDAASLPQLVENYVRGKL